VSEKDSYHAFLFLRRQEIWTFQDFGEDSGMHINNFVWAYNVDTKQLSRILSVPAGAEATGLKLVLQNI
jgi:hypothetical protein